MLDPLRFYVSNFCKLNFPMENVEKLKKELLRRDLEIRNLQGLVTLDPLTKLLNRRGFMELAKKFFEEIRFFGEYPGRRKHFIIEAFSILFFDIDHFKKINDTYGHKVGDQILQFVASVISQKVRASDFVGRWGGEEIVVALVGADEKDGYLKAEEIRKAVKSKVRVRSLAGLTVTVSGGVASLEGEATVEDLIKHADSAMYQAKQQGRDRVVKFSGI